ncbi:uncharacterized protein LOC130737217 [Lotus japonicus]|uniref:uncharacterized protein LOC130737217 n=1 Tax=Lotus japonicus TaxID=34305 RepID=UPI002588382C|nr:uncharacterized protein LOC130737217 [Lotus japonicus]
MIFDHYLAVSTWSIAFIAPEAKVTKTLAWIRIPGLNAAFYNESFLMSVARFIGKPIKVDFNTLSGERGKYARICVELDLSKPVFGRIMIEDYWYKIEYEGLHVICTKCGCYGHRTRECAGMVPVAAKPSVEVAPGMGTQTEPGASQVVELAATGATQSGGDHTRVSITPENEKGNADDPTIRGEIPGSQSSVQHVESGDWMTVSRKKNQKTKSKETKGGPQQGSGKNKGGRDSNTKSLAQKEREPKKVFPEFKFKSAPAFNAGMAGGSGAKEDIPKKKKRSRGEETEGAKNLGHTLVKGAEKPTSPSWENTNLESSRMVGQDSMDLGEPTTGKAQERQTVAPTVEETSCTSMQVEDVAHEVQQ